MQLAPCNAGIQAQPAIERNDVLERFGSEYCFPGPERVYLNDRLAKAFSGGFFDNHLAA
jgi:hypothetical protein